MGRLRVADRLRVVSLVAVVFVTAFDGLALSTLVPQIAVDLHLGGLYGAFTAVYALALVTLTGLVLIQVDDLLVPGVVVAVLGTAMGSAATHALLALLAGLGLLALVTWTASGGLTRHWLHHTTKGRRRADGEAGG